jgi:mono/diheme cytochrome c family protein
MGQLVRTLALCILLMEAMLVLSSPLGHAQDTMFTPEFLHDPNNIAQGKQLWAGRCRLCHGKESYPGSAPPLQPWKYTPEFVFDRITNGFRAMPALKQEFSEAERRAIVAYVLSRNFSP